jgi:hypothetical protein
LQPINAREEEPIAPSLEETSSLFVAGHRDGVLVIAHCRQDSEGFPRIVRKPSHYTIGTTPVVVKIDLTAPSSAFVFCGEKVWRICYDEIVYSDPILNRVWFINTDDVSKMELPTVP